LQASEFLVKKYSDSKSLKKLFIMYFAQKQKLFETKFKFSCSKEKFVKKIVQK
jgi:hypothetical protein